MPTQRQIASADVTTALGYTPLAGLSGVDASAATVIVGGGTATPLATIAGTLAATAANAASALTAANAAATQAAAASTAAATATSDATAASSAAASAASAAAAASTAAGTASTAAASALASATTALTDAAAALAASAPLSSQTIAVPSTAYPTVSAVLLFLAGKSIAFGATIAIPVSGTIDEPAALDVAHPFGAQISIYGANSFQAMISAAYLGTGNNVLVTLTPLAGTPTAAVGDYISVANAVDGSGNPVLGLGGIWPISAIDSTGLVATVSIPGIVGAITAFGSAVQATVVKDKLLVPSGAYAIAGSGPGGMTFGGLAIAPQAGASVSVGLSLNQGCSVTLAASSPSPSVGLCGFGDFGISLSGAARVSGQVAITSAATGIFADSGCVCTLNQSVIANAQTALQVEDGAIVELPSSEFSYVASLGTCDGGRVRLNVSTVFGAPFGSSPLVSGVGYTPSLSAWSGGYVSAQVLGGVTPSFFPTPNTVSADGSFIAT